MVRPILLDKTYSSLNDALFDVDLKTEGVLYINIDPVPDNSEKAIDEVLEVARSHFNEVYHRIGEDGGNFSKAASWTLSQPKGEYFFNIEDDWLFDGRICIQEYINKIKSDPRGNALQCVATHESEVRNRIHFPPSLFNNKILKFMLEEFPIPENENPERWLSEVRLREDGLRYNVTFLGGVKCFDNGRKWMHKNGYRKSADNMIPDPRRPGRRNKNFIRWEKV